MSTDHREKQLAGFICSINQISDELALMLVKKGFVVSTMEEKITHDIIIHWNEFIKLLKIEKDELQKDSQRVLATHSQTLRGLVFIEGYFTLCYYWLL
jgi:hypothetical protein